MRCDRRKISNTINIKIGYRIPEVEELHFLGSKIMQVVHRKDDIKSRLARARRTCLEKRSQVSNIVSGIRKKSSKIIVWSAVVYGSETCDSRKVRGIEASDIRWVDKFTIEIFLQYSVKRFFIL